MTAVVLIGLPLLDTTGAGGQERSVIVPDLRARIDAALPSERVAVLVELRRVDATAPLALDRPRRAAEHAGDLAGLYTRAHERLRRGLPTDLALDVSAGTLLWIGGGLATRLTPGQIRQLEGAPEVQRIYYDGLERVRLAGTEPEEPPALWAPGLPAAPATQGGVSWGLEAIGAPELWRTGALGQGSVVAIIDSGVDGDHPLLSRKWRGLSIPAAQAWFDPWGLSTTPVDDGGIAGIGHGTIVMSMAVGSLEPGDTVFEGAQVRVIQDELEFVTGVAPGAEWVAANAFEGFGGIPDYTRRSVLLQAMQWVLDPDGDPATVSDVPDVLSNSWGFPSGGCEGLFDRAIDALELVGVPVIFAAGNRGAGFDTVASPAERADLLLNAFAVGAAVQRDGEVLVADNSLGGPSPCAPAAVKPEVVAPGSVALVRGRGTRSVEVRGLSAAATSWAAPHAAGSIALLKGLSPGASADELKAALFSTARDLPPAGLDNRSGAGLIDLVAAAERIGGLGGVRVAVASWSWDSTRHALEVRLVNVGRETFPAGSAELLDRPAGGERLSQAPVAAIAAGNRGRVVFEDLGPDLPRRSSPLGFRLSSGEASLLFTLRLRGEAAGAVTLQDGDLRFSADGHGRLGLVAATPGFEFLGRDWLVAGSIMLAAGERVSDASFVDVLGNPSLKTDPVGSDTDWRLLTASAGESSSRLESIDDRALHPLGVKVEETLELVEVSADAGFVVLRVSLEGSLEGSPHMLGVLLDWDLGSRDSVYWDSGLGASLMTRADSSGPWVALTAFPEPPTSHAAVPLGNVVAGRYTDEGGVLAGAAGFTDEQKARLLLLGGDDASTAHLSDWAQLIATGPMTRGSEGVFLIAVGSSLEALATALESARAHAASSEPGGPVAGAGDGLVLLPAYPNPFDPTRVAAVRLPFLVRRTPDPVNARLDVYTMSGQLVYREERELLASEPVRPFEWPGRLRDGDPVATGVYGYVIQVGREKRSGKVVVLK